MVRVNWATSSNHANASTVRRRGELLATPDAGRMEEAIAALCPRDSGAFDRFLADNRAKFAQFLPCLESPFLGWRDVLRLRLLRLLGMLPPWHSLDRELRAYFTDPRVRLAFSFQSKYLGMSPFQCPSLFPILSFRDYEYGVFHPIGGCGALTAGMARIAAELGAEVRLAEPVVGCPRIVYTDLDTSWFLSEWH